MTEFTTYHSTNATPDNEWIAYANGWQVRCVGATEQEAKDRALALWNRERARWDNVPHSDTVKPSQHEEIAIARGGWGEVKQHHLAGKVWLMNRTTGHKCRVSAGEVAGLMGQGYVKAGPRSK